MIEENKEKIKELFKILEKIPRIGGGKEIGLVVTKEDEKTVDLLSSAPNSNLASGFDLEKENVDEEFLKNLKETLENKKYIIVKIGSYLDPKIYNQLYLISKEGRMQFPSEEKEIVLDVPKSNLLVLVIPSDNLEKLNYDNLLSLTGPIVRLS